MTPRAPIPAVPSAPAPEPMGRGPDVGAPPDPIVPSPFRRDEIQSLVALIARCYAEYALTLNLNDPCEQHLRDPRAHFDSKHGELWVVRDAGGRVGASVGVLLHAPGSHAATEGLGPSDPARPIRGPAAEVKTVYVDRAWRRRGIARALTEHALREAFARGAARAILWSDTRFDAAHRLYESIGFVRFAERDIDDSNNSREYGYRRG